MATNGYHNSYFRRRRIGRASSPPTWACYEQIQQYEDDSDRSNSSDEDDDLQSISGSEGSSEDGVLVTGGNAEEARGREGRRAYPEDSDSSVEAPTKRNLGTGGIDSDDIDMDMGDGNGDGQLASEGREDLPPQSKKDIKGKQKAVEPFDADPDLEARKKQKEKRANKMSKRHERRSQPAYALRPILTIQRSQGFVWNQDLFVPPYIKDRYIASTSPPNSRGFISTSASSTNSALTEYEAVEVVEIRIKEGEFDDIIPSL